MVLTLFSPIHVNVINKSMPIQSISSLQLNKKRLQRLLNYILYKDLGAGRVVDLEKRNVSCVECFFYYLLTEMNNDHS